MTSFRLRWVSGLERRVIREIREPAGIKPLYEEALRTGARTEADRAEVFARFLQKKLGELIVSEELPKRALSLVISGMASSSVGWRELPYAPTPFPLDGRSLCSGEVNWIKPEWIGSTYLISGVAHRYDMMRGEETEIVGLMADPGLAAMRKRALLILPGTHSKHVWIEDQSMVDFRTFMTGELFDVLGRHSLLRASLDLDGRATSDSLSEPDRAAFQEGVRWAREHGLAAGLFRVRTRAVIGHSPLAENAHFFSGLLIGAELVEVIERAQDRPIILAATRELSELYRLALEVLAGSQKWIQLPPAQMERATITAHALFLSNRI